MTYYELRDFRFDVPQNTNLVEYRVSLAGDVCKKIVCGVVLCATILGIMLWTCSAAMDDGHAQKITIQHQDNTNVWKSLGDRPPIVPRP